jgi:mannan endo-1,4-beta-mannosidase
MPPVPSPSPAANGRFVGRVGANLYKDGSIYRFSGVNKYGLAGGPQVQQCGIARDSAGFARSLDATFAALVQMQVKVLRLWAFQTYAGPTGLDFTELDAVVARASANHIQVILTLENHWKDCTLPGLDKTDAFYQSGYKTPQGGYALSMVDYVKAIASHFRDEPAILMWQLMNEAQATDARALQNFAADLAGRIKAVDANHLVSVGTAACGQPGTVGADFRALHSDPNIDVVEGHDYGFDSQADPQCLADDYAAAQALHKPFFVGESGIKVTVPQRAPLMAAKMATAAKKGYAGYLIWEYGTDPEYGFGTAAGDPMTDVMVQAGSLF